MLKEQSFRLPDLTLNYAEGPPNGPPLVLLHGVTRGWRDFAPLLPSFLPRHHVFAWDARGHGASDRAPAGRYHVADYVPDAAAFVTFVAERTGQPAVVYGHSLGAMLAVAAAAEAPAAVRAVMLEDPPYHTMGRRVREGPWHSVFVGMREVARRGGPLREMVSALAAVRVPRADGGGMSLGEIRDPTSIRFGAACLSKVDPEVLTPPVDGAWLDGHDYAKAFAAVRRPALLMQADPAAGGAMSDEDADLAQSLMGDCTRVRLGGVGHQAHWGDTAGVMRLVHGFLESTG
jgi:pimeloyl-ACP methyl ester carboxylesterase